MMEEKHYIEAFAHTQLGVERILWDRIVQLFEGEKAGIVRQNIEDSKKGEDKRKTSTHELIKWAHFIGAINGREFVDLNEFNKGRNELIHGHGAWWHPNIYKSSLKKGIRFLKENRL